jgi:alkylhydroperoxidase family enzyme
MGLAGTRPGREDEDRRTNGHRSGLIIGRYFTIKASMNQAKFDALGEYRTSSLFTDAERAVLDYVTELTRNKRVELGTFSQLARFYSERQICEIVWLVASEHFYNMTNIGLNIHSDMLCEIGKSGTGHSERS